MYYNYRANTSLCAIPATNYITLTADMKYAGFVPRKSRPQFRCIFHKLGFSWVIIWNPTVMHVYITVAG